MRVRALIATTIAFALAGVQALPALAADPSKVLRVAFNAGETGFDPQAVNDNYSYMVGDSIFDALYTYDYFARPPRLVPNTAAAMPEITDGGRTFTVRLRPGIFFADDPAFKGKRRELVAEDYVYSIKRIFDPRVRSTSLYIFEHELVGLDEVLARARRTNEFDYDAPIEGLQALDRYTLRIRFRKPYYLFRHFLTSLPLAAVAREVVTAYQDGSQRVMDHPVGTGPYRLKEWTRGQKIVLEANPGYRDDPYPNPGDGSQPGDAEIAKGLAGRPMPFAGRVEISIVEEVQPRLLLFDRGKLDYEEVPIGIAERVLASNALRPEYAKRGVRLHREVSPSTSFIYFNMDDPIVGGYTPERIALRRAIALGYDRTSFIRTLRSGQSIPATQLPPPGFAGYDPSIPAKDEHDPAAARALLDKFGYRDRDGDGYREAPDGKPLTLVRASTTDSVARAVDEQWKRDMDAIGIRTTFIKQKWPELNRMGEAGQLMMWGLGNVAVIPDADTFYSLLYGGNIGSGNYAKLRLPEYDRLYEESRSIADERARTALFRKMNDLIHAYAPWIINVHDYGIVITQPWLRGFKPDPLLRYQWKFYDVAPH
ncbi:MAG TPA: ABC transporter substrate-binding protein [Casimicrobiaceae bacterium]|nr:ABC transporter substrate-binding protein [Casimicrobiaceae bacterium]